ncbi:MAG: 16S rRNA (guanine(527)-N(7))-methyltransferase RsmG [Bacteroidota bacterium]|nr:16S rRNA (guanine(527)-N(7))-methyltransferase RsmG [Bacteroidota bacterium]
MSKEILNTYFEGLTDEQLNLFNEFQSVFLEENNKVNLISRKDTENLFVHHILHSLAITAFVEFAPQTKIADIGTGGGFPGIPLAIFFPDANFTLIDSKKKKIEAVKRIIEKLGLKNVKAKRVRTTEHAEKFDFLTGRAVADYGKFYDEVNHLLRPGIKSSVPNGILYLKGGNFEDELRNIPQTTEVFDLAEVFEDEFFITKKMIYTLFE